VIYDPGDRRRWQSPFEEHFGISLPEPGLWTVDFKNVGRAKGAAIVSVFVAMSDNHEPVVTATIVQDGATVTFNACDSYDPEGDELSFAWFFDDVQVAGSAIGTYRFATAGTHRIDVMALDQDEVPGFKSTTVAVDVTDVLRP
jgi:hypothetical protein